ncbi:hypothetical protein ACFV1L_05205 [Kitasatospora sp. NPDC059646]|uniref:hypothetical protein n=1 Tax=Kitasatospora sp. NPDC059646 TaxID=3346893 RepID=UPI0036D04F31
MGLWREEKPRAAFRSFVQDRLALRQPGRGRRDGGELLPVVVQLVPRPDHAHNPDAVGVAAPPEHGGTDHERHMAYLYDRHLVPLGGSLRSLAEVSPLPLGCHAFVELDAVEDDEYDPHDGDGDALVVTDRRQSRYWAGGLRLLMPRWDRLQRMAVDHCRGIRPDLVLPFIGHWTPWRPGAREALAGATREQSFDVTLRTEGDALTAYYGDLPLSDLGSGSRDFFDRTALRVRETGGRATARAEQHRGSLKVFVEDSRPLRGAG